MPLNTIQDLLEGDSEDVRALVKRASQLSEDYENFLDNAVSDGHTRAPGLHASEISGCQRKAFYSLKGTPRDKTTPAAIWRRRFATGHAIHRMFQEDFERYGYANKHITFEAEVPIKPCPEQPLAAKWDIMSSCDGVFTIRDHALGPSILRVGLEIKTESPTSFEKRRAPDPKHVEQAHIYMACLDVPLMWFLYYNKGNQNYTGSYLEKFLVPFDPALWARLEERFEALHLAVLQDAPPPREESLACEFCAFASTCKPKYLTQRRGVHTPSARWSK